MKNTRFLVFFGLLLFSLAVSIKLFHVEATRRAIQEDVIELSKVKYGLFNIDEWKKVVARVVTAKVEELELTDANRSTMRKRINDLLTTVITDLESNFKRENEGSFKGFFKNAGASFLDIFGNMKRNIPEFTSQIMRFIDDPKNREDLREYILEKIDNYADNTFAETDYTLHNEILARHGIGSREETVAVLRTRASLLQAEKQPYSYALYAVLLLLMVVILAFKNIFRWELMVVIATAFLPLVLGILLPMIEIDARIAEMRFQLLGEQVRFSDQVIFYKSKSILEVVELMAEQGKPDLLAVGFLVLAFSVLFPFSKLISSLVYLSRKGSKNNKFLNFMIFKTGKWSMADVMVVAIFMSYIGFSGIVSEQLGQLEGLAKNADILTTNQSSLQTGFFMFAAFVLLSLAISQRIGDLKGAPYSSEP
ncbi:paraquat-inducible protein A [Cryomorpha ignava]|uniref:Paraquat-inducible protein A n=1 Tax=Cryomorpha ignava TaxID=101383 RepID=A0A7K3WP06_9FLAO|nr:paraquat-inducible protein A [Cryomorpha ignava]NEN22592.1 paraquat-inducible protein A [Cryomorpha ignava]